MANRNFPYTEQLAPFQRADDAWGDELVRVFGKLACNARYDGRGKGTDGSRLRKLHDAREAARITWFRSAD
jgi:hypothetical protein